MAEATAVTRDGRISPGDLGIWDDRHAEPLARIAQFLHRQGAVAGIQLAHAGRKASCDLPWKGGRALTAAEGGWPTVAPSPVPFRQGDPVPRELAEAGIPVGRNYQVPFADAIRKEAGVATGAVGLITEPAQANEIITSGSADLVLLAREMLREPYWALKAQQALNQDPAWPVPYGYAVRRRKPG